MKAEIKKRIDKINRGQVPEGYKKIQGQIMPDSWDIYKLEDVIASSDYGTSEQTNDTKGYPVLRMGNLVDGKISSENLVYVDLDRESFNNLKLEKGDLLFNRTNSYDLVGKVSLFDLDGDYTFASYLIRLKVINSKVLPKYLNYYMNLESSQRQIKTFSTKGVQQVNVNITTLKKFFKVKLPSKIFEQRKIADILSTWDKAIELKEKLIEQKKEQKKGLMQRLLTGKVRLPGFEGEWKKVRLGSIGSAYNGLTGKNKEDFGSGKPYIPYKNVFNGSRINIDQLEYVQISETEKQNKVKYGDIIFTTSSETPEEVGLSSVLLDHVDELYLNSFCFGYRLNDFNTLIPEFAQYLFRGNVFRKELLKLAQGSTRFNLSKNEVLKIKIKIPGLEEQKKIASVLTIFDREIDLLEQELEALKQQKKGLMQLLLTGKVRVKC